MTAMGIMTGVKKRRSGARNADHYFKAWLHREKIVVKGDFVKEWIEDAITLYGYTVEILAEALGVTKRTLQDWRSGKVNPTLQYVAKLAEILNRQSRLEENLPIAGKADWAPDGVTYCGEGNEALKGCGTYFHPHYMDGLCHECYDGMDDPSFVPRDIRLSQCMKDSLELFELVTNA